MAGKGRIRSVFLDISKCKECNVLLTAETASFAGHRIRSHCNNCHNNYYQRNKNLENKYGINLKEYNKLLELQGNICAICKTNNQKYKLTVDHDHVTGEVRGLLCNNCNAALGNLKEDENIIWNMMEYLKKYKWSKAS